MSLYMPAELNAGFAFARAKINALAGVFASMVPDADITLLVSGVLNVAAEARGVKLKTMENDTPKWVLLTNPNDTPILIRVDSIQYIRLPIPSERAPKGGTVIDVGGGRHIVKEDLRQVRQAVEGP